MIKNVSSVELNCDVTLLRLAKPTYQGNISCSANIKYTLNYTLDLLSRKYSDVVVLDSYVGQDVWWLYAQC